MGGGIDLGATNEVPGWGQARSVPPSTGSCAALDGEAPEEIVKGQAGTGCMGRGEMKHELQGETMAGGSLGIRWGGLFITYHQLWWVPPQMSLVVGGSSSHIIS